MIKIYQVESKDGWHQIMYSPKGKNQRQKCLKYISKNGGKLLISIEKTFNFKKFRFE